MGFELKASSAKKLIQKGFKADRCKTSLKLTMARIKLLKNKKAMHLTQMRREIGQLLANGQDETARIRVEHIIHEEKTVSAYELMEMYCELIVVRLSMIESQKYCPVDLKEAVAGLIFASLRCADIPELADIRKHFTLKYGNDFVKASTEVRTDSGVNPLIVGKLSSVAPDIKTKIKVLTSIAEEHNIIWDPRSLEEQPKQQQQPDVYLMGKQMEMESSGVKPSLSVDVEPKNHRESGSKIEEQDTSIQKDLILKLYKEAGLVPGRGTSVEENLHEMQEPSARNTSERVQQKLMSPESKNSVGSDTVKDGGGVEATNRVKPEKRKQEKDSDGGSARNRYSKFITVSSVEDDFSAEQYATELELRAEKLRMGTPFSDANQVSVEMLQKPASDKQQQRNESHNFSDKRRQSSSRLEAKKKSVVDDMNEEDCLRSEITVKESSENLNHGKSPINEDGINGRFEVVLEDNGNGVFGTNEASASNWMNDDSILDVFYDDRNLFSPKSSSNQYTVDQSPRRETSIDGFASQASDFHINEEGPDKHTNSTRTDEVIDQSMLDLDVNKSDGIVFPTIWTSRDDDLHSRSSSSVISSTEDDLDRMNIGDDFVAFQSDNLFTNKADQESLNLNFSSEEFIQDVWNLKPDVVSDDLGSERIIPNTYFDVNIFGITDEVKDGFPEASATGKFDLQDDLQSEKLLMDHSLAESSTTDIVIEEKQENLGISEENEDIFPDRSVIIDDEMNNSSEATVKCDDRGDDIKEATFSSVFVMSPERKLVDHASSGDKNMDLSSQNTDEDTASSMFNLASKDSFDHEITEKDVKLLSSELEVASHGYESNTHEIVTWESDIFKHGDDLNEGIKIDGREISQIVEEEEEEVTFKDSSHIVFDDYDSDHNDHIDIFNIVDDISVDLPFSHKESESSVLDLNLEDQHRNELFVNDDSGLEINSTECSYSSLSEHTKEAKSVSNNTSSGIYEGSCDSYSDYVDEINSISFSIESVISDDNTASVEKPCDPTDEAIDEKPCKKFDKEESTRTNIPCFNSDSNKDEAPKLSPPVIPKKKLIWRSRNEPADVEVSPSSKPTNQTNRLNLNDQSEYSLSNSSPSTPKTPASYESLAEKLRRKWASEKVQREMESVKKSPKPKPLRPLSMDSSLLMSESSSEEHTEYEDNAGSVKSLDLDSYWSTEKQDSKHLVSRLSTQQPSSRKILREKESVNKSTKPKPQIENIVNTRTFKSSSVDSNLLKSEPSPKDHTKSEDDAGSFRSPGLDSYESRVKQDSKLMVSRLLSPRPSKKATVDEDLIQERPNLRSLTSYQSVNRKSNSKNLLTEETTLKEQPPAQVPLENKLAKTATLDHKGSPKSLKLSSNASIGTLSSEGSLKIPSPEMSSPASKSIERMEGSKPSVSVSNDSINKERYSKTVPPEQSVEKSSSLIAEKANIADKEITTERNSEQPTSTSSLSSPKTPSDGQIKKGYNVVAYFQSLRSNYRRA